MLNALVTKIKKNGFVKNSYLYLLKDGKKGLNLFEIPDKIDEGDLGLIYPTYDSWLGGGRQVSTPEGGQDIKTYKKITFEAKLSYLNRKEAEFTQSHDREILQEIFDEDGLVDSDL